MNLAAQQFLGTVLEDVLCSRDDLSKDVRRRLDGTDQSGGRAGSDWSSGGVACGGCRGDVLSQFVLAGHHLLLSSVPGVGEGVFNDPVADRIHWKRGASFRGPTW